MIKVLKVYFTDGTHEITKKITTAPLSIIKLSYIGEQWGDGNGNFKEVSDIIQINK